MEKGHFLKSCTMHLPCDFSVNFICVLYQWLNVKFVKAGMLKFIQLEFNFLIIIPSYLTVEYDNIIDSSSHAWLSFKRAHKFWHGYFE